MCDLCHPLIDSQSVQKFLWVRLTQRPGDRLGLFLVIETQWTGGAGSTIPTRRSPRRARSAGSRSVGPLPARRRDRAPRPYPETARQEWGSSVRTRLAAGGNRVRTIGPAEKETAVERGPAADHRRLARRPVLNDPIQLIGPASPFGNSRETLRKSGTDGSNPVLSSGESGANLTFGGYPLAAGRCCGPTGRWSTKSWR
jgi:hypothetical protein